MRGGGAVVCVMREGGAVVCVMRGGECVQETLLYHLYVDYRSNKVHEFTS